MKVASIWILVILLSGCGGESFTGEALSLSPDSGAFDDAQGPPASDGDGRQWEAGSVAPDSLSPGESEAASRDVLNDPWPDDVVVEPAPDVRPNTCGLEPVAGDGTPQICCYGLPATVPWGPCPANVADYGCQCGPCGSWMPSGICYVPRAGTRASSTDPNACENCAFNSSAQKLECCSVLQPSNHGNCFHSAVKLPVVHCGCTVC